MRRFMWATGALLVLGLAACENDNDLVIVGDEPAAPRNLDAYYYGGAVYVTWELAPGWDGESFRVYSRRTDDPDYFLIAEVTSCAQSLCSYTDPNVAAGFTYEYYVTAFDAASGLETSTANSVNVAVPQPTPPPVPAAVEAIALDGANYIRWDATARSAADFSHYRVYLETSQGAFLLGDTDSEGFLDEVAENGLTYSYFVTALDTQGHESGGSALGVATPRPDFHGEWVYDYFAVPASSGFRFQASEDADPIVDGDAASRHFRLESDVDGWWLVPGPNTVVLPTAYATTALKCGPGADASCQSVEVAPTSGYVAEDLFLEAQTTYLMRVRGDDGQDHYAAIRVVLLGFDQDDRAIMIFDWAYQLQAGNPALSEHSRPASVRRR